jgi:hypothetical protein
MAIPKIDGILPIISTPFARDESPEWSALDGLLMKIQESVLGLTHDRHVAHKK